MRLHCPKCASEIAAVDVNIRQMVAKCRRCDNVFGFQSMVPDVVKETVPVQKTKHIVQIQTAKRLELSWGWRSWVAWLALGGSLYLMYALFATYGTDLLPLLCFGPFIALGLGWSVLILVNSTKIEVDFDRLKVTHGPLPWVAPIRWQSDSIQQLYCIDYRKGQYNTQYFATMAVLDGDRHHMLVESLDSAEHALYLEQQIEQFLGIADEKVKGEYQQ